MYFSVHLRVQAGFGAPSLLSNAYLGFFPRGVKRSGRETNHSSPPSAQVKNAWSYASTLQTSSWLGAKLSSGTTLPVTSALHKDLNVSNLRPVAEKSSALLLDINVSFFKHKYKN
jgi:hypothetical protein